MMMIMMMMMTMMIMKMMVMMTKTCTVRIIRCPCRNIMLTALSKEKEDRQTHREIPPQMYGPGLQTLRLN